MSGKYDGDATITEVVGRFRVWIEAPNFRGEVYIGRDRAAEMRDTLNQALRYWPQPDEETDRAE